MLQHLPQGHFSVSLLFHGSIQAHFYVPSQYPYVYCVLGSIAASFVVALEWSHFVSRSEHKKKLTILNMLSPPLS